MKPKNRKNTRGGRKIGYVVVICAGYMVCCRRVDELKAHSPDSKFDGHAYAYFVEHLLAPAVREHLDIGPDIEIHGIEDNVRLHKSPPVVAAKARANVRILEGYPCYSPDLNPIENFFANLVKFIDMRYRLVQPVSLHEFDLEILTAMQELEASGLCERLYGSMPERLHDVVHAGGGATRW